MKADNGFILMTTILILSVISILLLTLMHHIYMYYKIINRLEQTHYHFYQMERFAAQIAKQDPTSWNKKCLKSRRVDDLSLPHRLLTMGCSYQANGVFYLIEDLGVKPVLCISNAASHHYLISVGIQENTFINSVVQLRVIKREAEFPCKNPQTFFKEGISSWSSAFSI